MIAKLLSMTSVVMVLLWSGADIGAVALSDGVLQKLRESGQLDDYLQRMQDLRRQAGTDQAYLKPSLQPTAKPLTIGTQNIPVILIDFSDKPSAAGYAAATPQMFDSLLFSDNRLNPTGSMKEYYLENSYDQYIVQGTVAGWYHTGIEHWAYNNITESYDFYGLRPQDLVLAAVQQANADIDFSQFDSNNDGYVDGVIIVHSGTGYEESGLTTEIHSHQGFVSPIAVDGKIVNRYVIVPEESSGGQSMSAIGVICHEWGHVLQLPDLYDTDYSSEGVGRWSLMASGNYNGGSRTPAHFDPWCKKELGWLTPINISANTNAVEIPAIEHNPVAYRLARNGSSFGTEYFLVENRRQVGFDAEIPGNGLFIYHIDENVIGNFDDWHPLVMVEQADGMFDLQYNRNVGDGSDPFPGTFGVRQFHDKTVPDSRNYTGFQTKVALWNISNSDSVMTADFEISFTRPWIEKDAAYFSDAAGGDGDMVFEAGEPIQIVLSITNEWATADNVTVTLSADDPTLTITEGSASYGTIAEGTTVDNSGQAFIFQIPSPVASRIDSFYFDITANSGAYHVVVGEEATIGRARIIVVDADNNDPDNLELNILQSLYKMRIPAATWNHAAFGAPFLYDLNPYYIMIWFTGVYRSNLLSSNDIAQIRDYLNRPAGGNLLMMGQGIAQQLSTQNPTFLNDYLRASYVDNPYHPVIDSTSQPAFPGIKLIQLANAPTNRIIGVNDGQSTLKYYGTTDKYAGVVYDGAYKSVFLTFGLENMKVTDSSRFEIKETILERVMQYFGELPVDVGDDDAMAINLPTILKLDQNAPNPFNPQTRITYTITLSGKTGLVPTRLEIFNILGQRQKVLVDRPQAPGQYSVVWDGKNEAGEQAASGLYFYRLSRGRESTAKKMILLK